MGSVAIFGFHGCSTRIVVHLTKWDPLNVLHFRGRPLGWPWEYSMILGPLCFFRQKPDSRIQSQKSACATHHRNGSKNGKFLFFLGVQKGFKHIMIIQGSRKDIRSGSKQGLLFLHVFFDLQVRHACILEAFYNPRNGTSLDMFCVFFSRGGETIYIHCACP